MLADPKFRLLILTTLLLCTTVVAETERATPSPPDDALSVFVEPPAYRHPPDALRFDLSGVPVPPTNPIEQALIASAHHAADAAARAHTQLSLAVYYKMRGLNEQAAHAKRKGEYWRRIARLAAADPA